MPVSIQMNKTLVFYNLTAENEMSNDTNAKHSRLAARIWLALWVMTDGLTCVLCVFTVQIFIE